MEIETQKIQAGRRTYFIDLKLASNDSKYIEITESKRSSDGTYKRNMIMVFEDHFEDFINALNEIMKPIIDQKQENTTQNFDEIRKKYPEAYKKWDDDADEKLLKLYSEGKSTEELAVIFSRTKGAITSRLEKLFDVDDTN